MGLGFDVEDDDDDFIGSSSSSESLARLILYFVDDIYLGLSFILPSFVDIFFRLPIMFVKCLLIGIKFSSQETHLLGLLILLPYLSYRSIYSQCARC